MMQSVDWSQASDLFAADGYGRSLLVDGLSLAHWQRYYNFLRKTEAELRFSADGQELPLPATLDESWFAPSRAATLHIRLVNLVLWCRLEETGHMRIDFRPEPIDGPLPLQLVLRTMSTLGRRLRRPVLLVHEKDERPLLRYRPEEGFTLLLMYA